MNTLELKMVKLLVDLRRNHGVMGIKAEFETEAARLNELMRLKEITSTAELKFVIKIGGPEAITNMFDAQHLGAYGIVAPMIESDYSMIKYLEAIDKYFPQDLRQNMHFGINIETLQGFKNLKKILNLAKIHLIDTITLGRVDMTGSLELRRNDINSLKIYEIAENIFMMAKNKGLTTTMGGGIAIEAVPFIKKLAKKKLLDRFETRKIIFNTPKDFSNIDKSIIKANTFELLWLENKKNYYSRICHEDDERIEMLRTRIK